MFVDLVGATSLSHSAAKRSRLEILLANFRFAELSTFTFLQVGFWVAPVCRQFDNWGRPGGVMVVLGVASRLR